MAGRGDRRWLRCAACVALVCAAALPGGARADGAAPGTNVWLAWTRGPGAEQCPDEGGFRARLAAKLGRDPVSPEATHTLSVRLSGDGRTLVAEVALLGKGGKAVGRRRIVTPGPGCAALVRAVVLSAAIALESVAPVGTPSTGDTGLTAPLPSAPDTSMVVPAPEPDDSPDAGPPDAPPRKASHAKRARPVPAASRSSWLWLSAAAVDTAIGLPGPAPGVRLGTGLSFGRFALAIDLEADLPSSVAIPGGTIDAWRARVALSPCLAAGPLRACARLGAGLLRLGATGLRAARTSTLADAFLGAGLRYRHPLADRLSLLVLADIAVPLVHTEARDSVTHAVYWSTPGVEATLGIGLAWAPP